MSRLCSSCCRGWFRSVGDLYALLQRCNKVQHGRADFAGAVYGCEMAAGQECQRGAEKPGEWPCNSVYIQVSVVTPPKHQGGYPACLQRLANLCCLTGVEVGGSPNQLQSPGFSLVRAQHLTHAVRFSEPSRQHRE